MITITRNKDIERIIEGLLFSTNEPIPLFKLKEIIELTYPITLAELRNFIQDLQMSYKNENRGFQLDEIAEGYCLRTIEDLFPYIEYLHKRRKADKMSKASMEVLAIIAFKQPITRAQIENVRGVDSTGTIYALLERGFIEVKGKMESPGRPSLYGLTKGFLKHFGLKDFNQLMPLLLRNKQEV